MTPGFSLTWPASVRCTGWLGRFRETPKKNLQKSQNSSCNRVTRGYSAHMTTNKANAAIATNYRKAEKLAAAARHAAAQAKDGNAELNAAAVTADAELAHARAAYWEAGF